jgi:hypothetical protein
LIAIEQCLHQRVHGWNAHRLLLVLFKAMKRKTSRLCQGAFAKRFYRMLFPITPGLKASLLLKAVQQAINCRGLCLNSGSGFRAQDWPALFKKRYVEYKL